LQSVHALSDHLVHSDPAIQRFETWARSRWTRGFSLEHAAKAAGLSKRTLGRRLQAVLGKSPLEYFQSRRLERAPTPAQDG
jgi:transcriptional regulator GlxA family with amidase domain